MVREFTCVLAIGPHAGVGQKLAFFAVYMQERFLLAFAKHKMRDRLAVLGYREPLAGGLGVGGGLDGPLGLGGKREQQRKGENLFHDHWFPAIMNHKG